MLTGRTMVGRGCPAGSEERAGLFGGCGCESGGSCEERVAWGKRSKIFNRMYDRGSWVRMARENRNTVLRFCWLVG